MKLRHTVFIAFLLAGCGEAEQEGVQKGKALTGTSKTLTVTSTAFVDGGALPRKYAYKGEGDNVSPPISWSGAPGEAKEFVLICDDPDAPRAEPWVHWVLYKIPATMTSLAEGENDNVVEGKNDFKEMGWGGPMPPKGHGVHHYHFKVYALASPLFDVPLDGPTDLKAGATKQLVMEAMKDRVLAWGELIGTYERK